MKKLTKRLLVFTAAIAMLTGTVSAANAPFGKNMKLGETYATALSNKDDSDYNAYITTKTTGSVPDKYNAISAFVERDDGKAVTKSIYLKYNTKKTVEYYPGLNFSGLDYRLKITYFANPALVPPQAYISGVWCP